MAIPSYCMIVNEARDTFVAGPLATSTTAFMTALRAISSGLASPFSAASGWTDSPIIPVALNRGEALEEWIGVTAQRTGATDQAIAAAREAFAGVAEKGDPGYSVAQVVNARVAPTVDDIAGALATLMPALQAAGAALTPTPHTPAGATDVPSAATSYNDLRALAVAEGASTTAIDSAWQAFADVVSPGSFELAVALIALGAPQTWNDASPPATWAQRMGQFQSSSDLWIAYRDVAVSDTVIGPASAFEPGLPPLIPPSYG